MVQKNTNHNLSSRSGIRMEANKRVLLLNFRALKYLCGSKKTNHMSMEVNISMGMVPYIFLSPFPYRGQVVVQKNKPKLVFAKRDEYRGANKSSFRSIRFFAFPALPKELYFFKIFFSIFLTNFIQSAQFSSL
jgi:hypothetical protein